MARDGMGMCKGKIAFDSAKLAHLIVRREQDTRGKRQVYRCRYCGLYHIGTRLKTLSADRKRETSFAHSRHGFPGIDFDDLN